MSQYTEYLENYGKRAKKAAAELAVLPVQIKNNILRTAADMLVSNSAEIIAANNLDLENAKTNGMSVSMQDRLRLTEARLEGMADGLLKLVALKDPVGNVIGGHTCENGLQIIKKTVPLGVLGIIFEARPNVTADAAGLSIKSGNACILRGGKEAINSNLAVAKIFSQALEANGVSPDCVQLIDNTSREVATELMQMNKYVDVLIPRGGRGLIESVVKNSTVPVIQTGTGNCHIYVDEDADLKMALDVIINAKTQRPSVCNAVETVLISSVIADIFIPAMARELIERNTQLRVCKETMSAIKASGCENIDMSYVIEAQDADWDTEYNDYILALKIVNDVDEAISHINEHGTRHSEAIITENFTTAVKFQELVDASCVYVNASTRFTDGFEFGLGAEIGISNQKLHARGPMGLCELTTYKYIINGKGQIRK
ncbi:MAG: glutamate-5-semialdehyde dehydrogenase [Ruminococcaceae bacterium]|nr:glutamate-5-semialdehyde dehydrogenase [Oscillospiraceae bacterium]